MQGTREEAGVAPKMMQGSGKPVFINSAGHETAVFLKLAVGYIGGGNLMCFSGSEVTIPSSG